jgi:hypothetical protein
LIRIAGEANHLALAETELPGMLMMSNYSCRRTAGVFSEEGEMTLRAPLLPRHTQWSGEHKRHNPRRSISLGSADRAEGLGLSTQRGWLDS